MDTHVIDITEADFEREVLEKSRTVPVLVDFWAAWCQPCKMLGPVLEKLAVEAAGAFRLCKVDTESEARLAGLFQIQSIPYVVAFQGGRPADAFVGVLDEAKIREFLGRLGVSFDAADADADAPPAPQSAFDKASALLRGRRMDEAERAFALLGEAEEDDEEYTRSQRLLDARGFFTGDLSGQGEAAAAARQAHEAWMAGDERRAMELLLESVAADRGWKDELGRKALVALMQLHDEHADVIGALRRRLAVLLY